MRGNKFEKSHIHILESETLSRESRVTEFAQEIVDSPLYLLTLHLCLPFVNTYLLLCRGVFYKNVGRFPQRTLIYAEHYTSYGYSFRIYGDYE